MKKVTLILSVVGLLTACGSSEKETQTTVDSTSVVSVDTLVVDTLVKKVDTSAVVTKTVEVKAGK